MKIFLKLMLTLATIASIIFLPMIAAWLWVDKLPQEHLLVWIIGLCAIIFGVGGALLGGCLFMVGLFTLLTLGRGLYRLYKEYKRWLLS